jgi:hypothetical protein
VAALQRRLTHAGFPIDVDGWYGPGTERTVRAWQRAHGLIADGIAGPRTQAALLGAADPRALRQADVEAAAGVLGCDVAALQAVVEVESPAGGYLADGRVVILFERHVFWRQLEQRGIEPATLGAPASILSKDRGGYLGGAAEYQRLALAQAYGVEPAMESCSWGRFQIMGLHARSLGYESASAMASRFATGEGEQLRAFVNFILADDGLKKALRARKWVAFARLYNGPAYSENLYDMRLARAYAKHAVAMEAA